MTKLHQLLPIEQGVKATSNRAIDELYKLIQKPALFNGLTRTYQPIDETGEQLPPEQQLVQVRTEPVLQDLAKYWTRLMDVTLTKDTANLTATANIVLDGAELATDVPVTFLLFLEKQLTNLHTIVSKLPLIDPTAQWIPNEDQGVYETLPIQTTRTKKIPRSFIKAPATDKHPAQADTYFEDVIIGYYNLVKLSGATTPARQTQLLERIEKLQAAVKMAREEANQQDVVDREIGATLFDYLLAP